MRNFYITTHRFFAAHDDPSNDKEIVVKPTAECEPPKKVIKEEAASPPHAAKVDGEPPPLPLPSLPPMPPPSAERMGSAKKRIKKPPVPQNPSDKKSKPQADPYSEQMDLFRKISKNNMAHQSKKSSDTDSAKEEYKTPKDEKHDLKGLSAAASEEEKLQQILSQPQRVTMFEAEPSGRRNNSMVVLKKEFFRPQPEGTAVNLVPIKMLIEGKNNEVLQLQFEYNLYTDSPGSVATEMVKALSLYESDIPKIESIIKDVLSMIICYAEGCNVLTRKM